MKNNTTQPVLKKEKPWKLKTLTCLELANLVVGAIPADMKENAANASLRKRYAHPKQVEKLKLADGLNARYHAAHVRTAARLMVVPTIEMRVAGGKPDPKKMPRYDASLKRMAARHGIVIHRWESGAFILAKNPPRLEPVTASLCDQSFSLEP